MRIPPDHRVDLSPHPGLFELLAAATRRRSDGTLALATGAGLVLAVAALVAGLPWRPLALAAGAAAAFGGWAILDRTLAERRSAGPAHPADAGLRAAGIALLAAGSIALGVFLLFGLGHVLDGVIH